ncbi:MAG: penicillin-binding protein activator LpoB [Spirochaetes bacterium]|nr:penicillin-binding protein activator LpoB [Spirochaetota bacterium]
MKHSILILLTVVVALFALSSCASSPKRLDANKDIVADTGELTRWELEKAAVRLGQSIGAYFKKHPEKEGVFVALLPTKNETSEQIAVKVFDNNLVAELRKNDVFTIRTETRNQSLAEIEFSMSGLAEKPLSVGKMKSPNYFIKIDITEDMYRSSGDRIVEQVINVELINVLTQVVAWSDKKVYRKQAVSGGGTSW